MKHSRPWIAVLRKELTSELRVRFGVSVLVMFLIITVSIISFSLPGERISPSMFSALFWITIFFGGMTGLSRAFISEEERGTALLLRLYAPPDSVYLGKLAFNVLLILFLGLAAILLFLFFFRDFAVQDILGFILQTILGGTGIAVVSTILSALIGRARQKGALLPILAMPVLIPLVIASTDAARISIELPNAWEGIRGDILILFSFDAAMILVSYVLFEAIWKD